MEDFSTLLPPTFKKVVQEWITEDIPSFDFGAFVVGNKEDEANLLVKSSLVLAGVPFANEILDTFELKYEWKIKEGTYIEYKNSPILTCIVKGKAKNLLQAERTLLNMLHRCSAIATHCKRFTDVAKEHNYKGFIAGTRKTTPGFRIIEKYALLVGGCATHRHDLSSMCMLKDNHIDSCGGITQAVEKAKKVCGFTTMIEVECRSLKDALEASEAGAHIVMLDNFEPEKCKETAKEIKKKYPKVTVEASGGIDVKSISSYFCEEIDVLSIGGLTQGIPTVDISFKIKKN